MILIYKVVNDVNEKVYVGQTTRTLATRLIEHRSHKRNYHIRNAIHKYGLEHFRIELITITHTQEVADYWESYFIEKFDSIENGYNLKLGGYKGKHSEESKKKMSESRKGQHNSPNTEFKKGVSASPSTQFKKGRIPWNKKVTHGW